MDSRRDQRPLQVEHLERPRAGDRGSWDPFVDDPATFEWRSKAHWVTIVGPVTLAGARPESYAERWYHPVVHPSSKPELSP